MGRKTKRRTFLKSGKVKGYKKRISNSRNAQRRIKDKFFMDLKAKDKE